ncbi:MAG: hypothetical protein QM613_01895 [Micrococcaceae bacterium]
MAKGSEEPVEWVEETQAVEEYRIDIEALRNWEHIFRHKIVNGVYYYPQEDLKNIETMLKQGVQKWKKFQFMF